MSYKGFLIPCKAWYADVAGKVEEYIEIGIFSESGVTQGGIMIEWDGLDMRLKAYDYSWETLSQMPELINLLAAVSRPENKPTLEEFAEMLKKLGYKDQTGYERRDI